MTEIYNDTFTEASDTTLASHTPDTGTSWTILIQANQGDETLHVHSSDNICDKETGGLSDGVLYTADATYSTADYGVQILMVDPDGGDDYNILAVRVQDSNNMYALEFNEDKFQLYKKTTAGGWETLGDDQGAIVVANDTVRLEIGGTILQGLVNGVVKSSVSDSSHSAAGKAGYGMGSVITSGADMSGQEIDDFNVNDNALATTTSTSTTTSTTTTSTSTTTSSSTSTSTTTTSTSTTTSSSTSTSTSTTTTSTSTTTTTSSSTSTSTTNTGTTSSTSTTTTTTSTSTTTTTTSTSTTTTLPTADVPEVKVELSNPAIEVEQI